MKYILAVALGFKKYRKKLECKISSRHLIDHLVIDENINVHNKWEWNLNPTKPKVLDYYNILDLISGKHPLNELPEKMFFFEVPEQSLGDAIKLDFDCEDNNYTNGFMTKTSLVAIKTVQLLPKKIVEHLVKEHTALHRAVKRWELRSRFPRPENGIRHGCWPCNKSTWKWGGFAENNQLDDETLNGQMGLGAPQIRTDIPPVWLGGKFHITIPLIRKFGIRMFEPYNSFGQNYGKLVTNFFQWKQYFKKYYDINIRNEDQ